MLTGSSKTQVRMDCLAQANQASSLCCICREIFIADYNRLDHNIPTDDRFPFIAEQIVQLIVPRKTFSGRKASTLKTNTCQECEEKVTNISRNIIDLIEIYRLSLAKSDYADASQASGEEDNGLDEIYGGDTDDDDQDGNYNDGGCDDDSLLTTNVQDRTNGFHVTEPSDEGSQFSPDVSALFSRQTAGSQKRSRLHPRRKLEEPQSLEEYSELKTFTCKTCGDGFPKEQGLLAHQRVHLTETTNKCSKCDSEFHNSHQLDKHMRSHLEENPYSCSKCDLTFKRKKSLKSHMVLHKGQKYLRSARPISIRKSPLKKQLKPTNSYPKAKAEVGETCEGISYAESSDGTEDYQNDVPDPTLVAENEPEPETPDKEDEEKSKGYTCNDCDCTFKTHFTLERHMKSHTGERPFNCPHCDKNFSTNYQKRRHVESVHSGSKPFSCKVCHHSFAEKQALTTHQRVHTGEKPYKCENCDRAFASPYRRKLHMRHHLGIYPYQCSECGACFTRSDTLKYHMRRHTGEKPVKCTHCELTFRTRTNFMVHLKTKHSDNPPTYTCTVCSTVFRSQSSLRNHTRMHGNVEPFLCSICGASFKYRSSFDYHSKTHQSEKPFKCPHCPKTFKVMQILKGHIRIHTGEKPFMCAVCGKAFSQQGQLGRHSVVHSDVKAHRCSFCQKAFNRKDKLTYHLQKFHNKCLTKNDILTNYDNPSGKGEIVRPHKCPFCDKCYTRKSKVKEHVGKIHSHVFSETSREQTTNNSTSTTTAPEDTAAVLPTADTSCNISLNNSNLLPLKPLHHPPLPDPQANIRIAPMPPQNPPLANNTPLVIQPQTEAVYHNPLVPPPGSLNESMCQGMGGMSFMSIPNLSYHHYPGAK